MGGRVLRELLLLWRPSRLKHQVVEYVLQRYVSKGFSVLFEDLA